MRPLTACAGGILIRHSGAIEEPQKPDRDKMSSPRDLVRVTGADEELELDGGVPLDLSTAASADRLLAPERPRGPPRANTPPSAALTVNSGGASEKKELRPEQRALTEASLKGKNSVVVAPTGFGKTLVAAHVILKHLEAKPSSRVVMLVPTGPLVEQQSLQLRAYLAAHSASPERWVVGSLVGGANSSPRAMTLRSNHVTVMTPALLHNVFCHVEEQERVWIREFSLIVFDEAHHCDAQHPYQQVMQVYLDSKHGLAGRGGEKGALPQILGMTASLGVGGSDELKAAAAHVVEICARLDAEVLCSAADETSQGRDEVALVPRPASPSPFARNTEKQPESTLEELESAMCRVEEMVRRQLKPLEELIERKVREANEGQAGGLKPLLVPSGRESQPYEEWLCNYLRFLPEVRELRDSPDSLGRRTVTLLCLEHLRVYQRALLLSGHSSSAQALKLLRAETEARDGALRLHNEDALRDKDSKELFRIAKDLLSTLSSLPNTESPLLQRLRSEILGQFARAADSRVLVFAKQRDYVAALKDVFAKDPATEHLRPHYITSINTAANEGGQTEVEQKSVLDDFRSGRCSLLFATTVAEEGLDIARCNLVLKYNHVTNEIALVQKRGRGRAKDARSLLLTDQPKVREKENANAQRERLMHQVIQHFKSQPASSFVELVRSAEAELVAGRKEELAERVWSASRKRTTYVLRCKTCEAEVCRSDALRKIDCHVVVADPAFWTRVSITPRQAPLSFYALAICADTGALFCAGCPSGDLGQVLFSGATFYPSLKKDRVTIEDPQDPKGKRELIRKWKKAEERVEIRPLEEGDRRAMAASLLRQDPQMETLLKAILGANSNR